ncbi:hypothetical protein CEQ90_00990 [Lewinellaceae bacterium SD302]|nr:hypothetical protein CEQ90_00990 [Lewinellaceae bacterium SD302]
MKINQLFPVLVLLGLLNIFSCSKDGFNLSKLDETIYVRHRGADMPAYVHGNASEKLFLIYLHGGPGGLGWEARVNTMITEVEKNNAVVYFDQRGSGNAQGKYSDDDVSIDAMADDVLALVKVLKSRYGDDASFFLMGASWGGTLGPATLLKDQESFLGWIDVSGAHSPKDLYGEYQIILPETANTQIALGNSVTHWQDVLELVQETDPGYSDEDFFKLNSTAHASEGVLAEDMVIDEPRFLDENGKDWRWPIRNNPEISIILTVDKGLYRDVSFTDRLPEITIPSLVLWGRHDLVVPIRFAQEALEHLGSDHKELFIFERAGHGPLESEPDLFAEKLIEFINEHR